MIEFKEELFNLGAYNKAVDCLKDYKEEASNIPLDLDVDPYGFIGCQTVYAEDKGKVVAFCVVRVKNHHHHNVDLGYVEALYVRPDYRGSTGIRLIKHTEMYLRNIGVSGMLISYSIKNDISKLLNRLGYQQTEVVTFKEL